jgi:hypothetical protein
VGQIPSHRFFEDMLYRFRHLITTFRVRDPLFHERHFAFYDLVKTVELFLVTNGMSTDSHKSPVGCGDGTTIAWVLRRC